MFFDFFTRSYQSKEYIDTINELQHVPALIETIPRRRPNRTARQQRRSKRITLPPR